MSYKIFQVFGNYGVSVDGKINLDDCSVAYENGDTYSSEPANHHDIKTQEWYEFERIKEEILNDDSFNEKLMKVEEKDEEIIVLEY